MKKSIKSGKTRAFIRNVSVADISQFGNLVVDGYTQCNAGAMPQNLQDDLNILTDTLVEGMTENYNRLVATKESPQNEAECELFMDMQRKYCDKIPGYADKAKDLFLEDF